MILRIEESDRWMSFFTPVQISYLENWQNAETEDIPESMKLPYIMLFDKKDVSNLPPYIVEDILRKEYMFLKETDLYTFRIIQREAFHYGYIPSAGALLFCVYEYKRILNHSRKEILRINSPYQYHVNLKRFITENKYFYAGSEDYMSESSKEKRRNIMFEYLWFDYLKDLDLSVKKGIIVILYREIKGKCENIHRARITGDILNRLSRDTVDFIYKIPSEDAVPELFAEEFMREFCCLPAWMVEYGQQMSRLDMLEKDIEFFKRVKPLNLKFEVEHKGFIKFIFQSYTNGSISKAHEYSAIGNRKLKNRSEPIIKRFKMLVDKEREVYHAPTGRKLNSGKLALEIPTGRGKVFKRYAEIPTPDVFFILLFDISKSVKKRGYVHILANALDIIATSLKDLNIPFDTILFNEDVIVADGAFNIGNIAMYCKGKTNLEHAIKTAYERARSNPRGKKGVIIIFTDGEPTKGMKDTYLREYILKISTVIPVIGIGVKGVDKVKYYFGDRGIEINSMYDLTITLVRTIEKYVTKAMPLTH